MSRRPAGVSLIDVLIVVAIVAILAAIAIPRFAATRTKRYMADMKSDLRALAAVEDAFNTDSSYYTRTLPPGRFRSSPGVSPPTIVASDSGYTATVTSTNLPGVTCGVAVGLRNPVDASAADGEPACR